MPLLAVSTSSFELPWEQKAKLWGLFISEGVIRSQLKGKLFEEA